MRCNVCPVGCPGEEPGWGSASACWKMVSLSCSNTCIITIFSIYCEAEQHHRWRVSGEEQRLLKTWDRTENAESGEKMERKSDEHRRRRETMSPCLIQAKVDVFYFCLFLNQCVIYFECKLSCALSQMCTRSWCVFRPLSLWAALTIYYYNP